MTALPFRSFPLWPKKRLPDGTGVDRTETAPVLFRTEHRAAGHDLASEIRGDLSAAHHVGGMLL